MCGWVPGEMDDPAASDIPYLPLRNVLAASDTVGLDLNTIVILFCHHMAPASAENPASVSNRASQHTMSSSLPVS